MLSVLDTFAGIGGFSVGLELTGHFHTVGFVEIEPYPRKILKRHWPGIPIYDDIKTFTAARVRADGFIRGPIDVITGGFPCTDVSLAGKHAGITGEATGLWKQLARTIGEFRPRYAILENVAALLSGDRGRWFGEVLGDLASLGYDAEWHCITAASIGAPHRRDRVFIIATDTRRPVEGRRLQPERESDQRDPEPAGHGPERTVADAQRSGRPAGSGAGPGEEESKIGDRDYAERRGGPVPDTLGQRLEGLIQARAAARAAHRSSDGRDPSWWSFEPDVCRVVDGLPYRVDRLRALGNAIVPEIAMLIGESIAAREGL